MPIVFDPGEATPKKQKYNRLQFCVSYRAAGFRFNSLDLQISQPLANYAMDMMLSVFLLFFTCFYLCIDATPVAKFEVSSVDSRSIVVRMIESPNVTRLDLDVIIYDLDHLREFRRSSLSTSRYQDQASVLEHLKCFQITFWGVSIATV